MKNLERENHHILEELEQLDETTGMQVYCYNSINFNSRQLRSGKVTLEETGG